MKNTPSPWSVPVAVEQIPETGLHVELEAPAATRDALTVFASLRALPRLTAVFDVVRRGAGVRITGRVSALVGQTCVVTLEPMDSEVDEAVDLSFAPLPPGGEVKESEAAGHRLEEGEGEPPEPLVGGRLDLGAIATEFLILGIDPYPRKAGAAFAPSPSEEGGPHPFAALAALKKPPGSGT